MKRYVNYSNFNLFGVLIVLLLFLFSCNGGSKIPEEYIKVMGTAGMLIKSPGVKAFDTDPSPANADAIMPSWYYKGAWQFGDIVTIGTDGHFSVDLPKDSGRCVLLLVDTSQQAKIDQIVGYVAIGVDEEHNMLNFPASEATGDIDLGIIVQDSEQADEVKSDENNVNTIAANFDLTIDELKQMASNDKLLKSIKNWYANNHGDYWYGLNPVYMYTYYDLLSAKNNFLTPDTVFTSTSPTLEKEYTILYMTTVAEDDPTKPEFGNSELSLYFPVGTYTTIDAQDQDGNTGITIDGSQAVRLSTNPKLNQPVDLQDHRFWDQSGLGFFHDIVPDGQWVLKKDDVEIARYDLSTGDPFDSDGNIKVFVPAIRLNTTGDIVESIDIQWYLYDESMQEYQEVDPKSKAFLNVVDYFDIALTDYNTDPAISESFEIGSDGGTVGGNLSISDTQITPTEYEWTLGTPSPTQVNLNSLVVQYEVYGTRFMFDFR